MPFGLDMKNLMLTGMMAAPSHGKTIMEMNQMVTQSCAQQCMRSPTGSGLMIFVVAAIWDFVSVVSSMSYDWNLTAVGSLYGW